jgi:DUF4097 and DUF4098 domain-containing protein YvlB
MIAALVLAGLISGPLAVASPTPRSGEDQEKQTERVDRTIPFAPGGTIHLKNFSGKVRITGSSDGQVVIAAVRRATRERLDRIKLDIQSGPAEITINANHRSGDREERKNDNIVETDFEISVPADTRLDVDAFSSDVEISGVLGKQRVHTFSGPIVLRGGTGPLDLESFSGDVELEIVDATASPDLEVKTFSGSITATMPAATSGNVRFESFSGDIRSDIPLTLESGRKRNIRGRLNAGGGSEFYFKTFSGDVRIRRN